MDIPTFIENTIKFLNDTIVPFIFVLAFLFFIWNAFQYFIVQGHSEEGRAKAKRLMIWGIIAFVIMVSIWGIVNMLVTGGGFNTADPIGPDYLQEDPLGSFVSP